MSIKTLRQTFLKFYLIFSTLTNYLNSIIITPLQLSQLNIHVKLAATPMGPLGALEGGVGSGELIRKPFLKIYF